MNSTKRAVTFVFALLLASATALPGVCAKSRLEIRREKREERRNTWRVHRVRFTGLEHLRPWMLRQQMALAPRFLGRDPEFSRRKLRNDIRTLEYFCRQRGFLVSSVTLDSVVYDSLHCRVHRVDISISAVEGPRTSVRAVEVNPTTVLSDREIARLVKATRPGDPLVIERLEEDRRAIVARLADAGYLEARAEYAVGLSDDSLLADVTFQAAEGDLIRVGSIRVEGTRKVRDRVVLRECAFDVGDTLSRKKIRTTNDHLYRTGLFTIVTVRFDEADSGADVNGHARRVSLQVAEKDFFSVEFGVGYHTYEKVRGSAELRYGNFLGLGYVGRMLGKISFVTRRAELGMTLPWVVRLPVNLDASASYRWQLEKAYEGRFGETRVGLSSRFTDFSSGYVRHRFEDVNLMWSAEEDSVFKNTNSISTGLALDFRDDVLDPSRGIYANADVEWSGFAGPSSSQFVKTQFGLRGYASFGTPLVFATAARIGLADPVGGDSTIPIQERFYAGGSSVLRGFWYNEAGPLDAGGRPTGGNAYLTLDVLEVRFPIFRILSGAVFFDAGNLWYENAGTLLNTAKSIDVTDLRFNAGTGLRVKLPIGIVRLDVGFKLDRKADEGLAAVQVDMGQAF